MTAGAAAANRRETIVDLEALRDTFREDVLAGLAKAQKATPPKHLYDARGSEIFERICEVEEYYPTRTEASIFERAMDEVVALVGPGPVLIEPGSGAKEKAEKWLDALDGPVAYVPIEISRSAVDEAADALAELFPSVEIAPVCADFSREFPMPEDLPEGQRLVFFPGSTLGNFDPEPRARLLRSLARMAGPGGLVLVGTDLEKDPDVLRAAYDDSEGVTAAFNLNLLTRINRELRGTFEPDIFEHEAAWVPERGRIEMRLVSQQSHEVSVCGEPFRFRAGEWIHTESSYKMTPASVDAMAEGAGLELVRAWTDDRDWFRVSLLRVVG